ncbi:MAG: TIGR00282 family metallophosphoesterase [Pirellulaceae bacterium]
MDEKNPQQLRILLIGDIVGKPGRDIVRKLLPTVRQHYELDLVVANAENAAGGSGLTPQNYKELLATGIDGITLGDHIYRRREIYTVLEAQANIVKPANFPPEAPGRPWMTLTTASGHAVAVISVLGRVFMRPVDCPLAAVDRVLGELPDNQHAIIVDYHAEATSDMQVMGRYLDGRVSAVLGTHTHVATADEQIFPGGTAFQCDVGMTGPFASILGRRIDRVLETTKSFRPMPFDVASSDVRLQGTIVEVDPQTGKAQAICRISLAGCDTSNWP